MTVIVGTVTLCHGSNEYTVLSMCSSSKEMWSGLSPLVSNARLPQGWQETNEQHLQLEDQPSQIIRPTNSADL
jgi:hypothetical protein